MSALFRRLGVSTTASVSSAAARSFSASAARARAHITIVGHLADAPEPVTTGSGREIVRYTVASNSGYKDNRLTSWFRITSFDQGPSRDFLLSLSKGSLVYVEGEATIDTYNGPDGKPRNSLRVAQRHFDLLKRSAVEATSESHADSATQSYDEHHRSRDESGSA